MNYNDVKLVVDGVTIAGTKIVKRLVPEDAETIDCEPVKRTILDELMEMINIEAQCQADLEACSTISADRCFHNGAMTEAIRLRSAIRSFAIKHGIRIGEDSELRSAY